VSVTPLPDLPQLLDGLTRRHLCLETDQHGRLVLTGNVDAVDPLVALAVRWHADALRAVVAGRRTGHVVGICDHCGKWAMVGTRRVVERGRHAGEVVARSTWPRCYMTAGCAGRHRPTAGGDEPASNPAPSAPASALERTRRRPKAGSRPPPATPGRGRQSAPTEIRTTWSSMKG
jgi:hypothetical protein